jgi:hypothetical protein
MGHVKPNYAKLNYVKPNYAKLNDAKLNDAKLGFIRLAFGFTCKTDYYRLYDRIIIPRQQCSAL